MNEVGVGTPATKIYPQDRYPLVVVAVSKSGRRVSLVSMPELLPGDSTPERQIPAYRKGPWPVYNHRFTEEECMKVAKEHLESGGTGAITASLRKDGAWRVVGGHTEILMGVAQMYRDYSD